jgi:hypothetical protein
MKQIIVTIDSEGNTSVETKGFKGQGCKAASKALETALGARQSDKPTPEAFGSEGVRHPVKW